MEKDNIIVSSGKQSPLYQYSPYNPNSRMPLRVKFIILAVAVFVTLITILSLLVSDI